MIFTGTNYKLFCEAISNETVNGYKVLIETLGSTCHDEVSTEFLFLAAANIASATCGDKKYSRILIDNGALLFLQPALMHSNKAIVVNAGIIFILIVLCTYVHIYVILLCFISIYDCVSCKY